MGVEVGSLVAVGRGVLVGSGGLVAVVLVRLAADDSGVVLGGYVSVEAGLVMGIGLVGLSSVLTANAAHPVPPTKTRIKRNTVPPRNRVPKFLRFL
jgi:hypothetical protein